MKRFIAIVTVILSTFVLTPSASAESNVFLDPTGDVRQGTPGTNPVEEDPLARWQSGIDIKRTRVDLTNTRLLMRSTHVDLTRGNAYDESWLFLYTTAESARSGVPTYVVYNGGYEYTVQRTRTMYQVWHTSKSREVPCASKLAVRPDLDTITFTIARACIGNPWRVRFSQYITDDRTYNWVYDTNGAQGVWTTKS